ncbi:chloride channel protein [Devosia neptuniae]|jgi:H+/Cl- antiporter ClcA|uniref:chloride channel protein n=1 Tax=Devosia TaxID=46913 RepID=UPI0022AE9755|nr:chloride channel protein [Devosia neptuniae]MCZ4345971.1 chloride channel protein [Devosia neptuniae]|tara:strand:+ start:5727 stop:7037 length:1311 start_codon:yes stop_codon:yes gene_type:complete
MATRSFKQALNLRWRRIWLPRLRRRALFVVGGVFVGLAAVAMAFMADGAQHLFRMAQHQWPYLPLLITPAGFAFLAWVTQRYFNGAQGSGIPQVIAARQMTDLKAKQKLVSPKLAVAKMFLLSAGLLLGASAGREGPTVQVGASVMFWLGRFAPHRQPGLLLAGAAGGVAAAFNAPLAGIVFGIEEMSRSFELRTSGLVLGTVIVAGLTSLAILGDYTYFGRSAVTLEIGAQWIAVPVVGLVCGLAGGGFSRVVIAFAVGLPGRAGRVIKKHPVLFAAICGMIVAVAGVLTGGAAFGTSAEEAKAILAGEDITGLFGPLKLIATIATAISGIPGGIFSPSLSIGAGFATLLQGMLHIPIGALAIMCMAAYLAAVLQAPITAFVIVTEMTGNHALIFPVMMCAVIASFVSKSVCKEGIYHALAHQILRKSQSERNIT